MASVAWRGWTGAAWRIPALAFAAMLLVRGGPGHAAVSFHDAERPVLAAALGYSPRSGDLAANRVAIAALVEHAARLGARYVAAPELALTGSVPDGCVPAAGVAETVPGPSTRFLGEQARRHGIWLAVSLLQREASSQCFVTAVLLGPDGRIHQTAQKVLVRGGPDAGASSGAFRHVADSIDANPLRLGIVSVDDGIAGVPRLAERGARVILVNGDAAADPGAARTRLAELAARNATVLIVAGPPCAEGASCLTSVYGATYSRHTLAEGTIHLVAVPSAPSWFIPTEPGLPDTVPVPTVDPGSDAIAMLGRRLFTDRRLSSSGAVACATCHDPQRAFTNELPRGVGVYGRTTKRNVPSLLNVAFKPQLQWDGYASSLETFAKYPMSNVNEMNFHYLDQAVPYVRSRPEYVEAFRASMSVDTIEFEHVAAALAAYARTLISGNSAFDRYTYGGDSSAISPSAIRGLQMFTGRGRCATCHTISARHALFTDFQYHNLGVGFDASTGRYRDIGLGGISTNDLSGMFLTPSLRNAALTAPYMHDGSLATLDAVVDFYAPVNETAPRAALPPLRLSASERRDLIAFLQSLTGDQRYDADGRRLAAGVPTPTRAAVARAGGR